MILFLLLTSAPASAQAQVNAVASPVASDSPVTAAEGPAYGTPALTPTVTRSTPIATPVPRPVHGGWEGEVLQEVARAYGWPPVLTTESSGSLTVGRSSSSSEWTRALVKPFEYAAGAEAAAAAAQNDARLEGLVVRPEMIEGYPGYWATRSEGGQVSEQRVHWWAGRWIMGVEAAGASLSREQLAAIARFFVQRAREYGLPAPPAPLTDPTAAPTGAPASMPTGTPSALPTACLVSFSDLQPGHWAYPYVRDLACDGIVTGYTDGTFRPLRPSTRAQLAKLIVLLEGWEVMEPERASYTDVGKGHGFFVYIETASARGIIEGYSDGTYRPDANVTRAQVAKMVALARQWPLVSGAYLPLRDVPPAHWASSYIQTGIKRGLFSGYSGGFFEPDADATRAQLAKVLARAYR